MKYSPPQTKSVELRMMTPMIDVIFLLLIFFVCTANFTPPEGILSMNTALPEGMTGGMTTEIVLPDLVNHDTMLIQISFDQKPHWQIEGNHCSSLHEVHNVLQAIHAINPDISVTIESSDAVPAENVIDICDICRLVGLSQIQFPAY